MELVALGALLLTGLWGLVGIGKLLERLVEINRSLQEIKALLQNRT